jgi:hypothetical protein
MGRMGKKKKRREQNTSRQPGPRASDVIDGPGFRMERRGRMILSQTNRTEAEQRELTRRLAESVPQIEAEILQLSKSIESQLDACDSFAVLGSIFLRNFLADPETYKEYSFEGRSFVAEYAALLALKHPYSRGKTALVDPSVIERIQETVTDIFQKVTWLAMARDAKRYPDSAPGKLRELQFLAYLNELTVRAPAYSHHLHEVLRGLFQPMEDVLLRSAGHTIDDALKISEAIPKIIETRLKERLQQAREGSTQIERELADIKRGKFPRDGNPEQIAFMRKLAALPRKDRKRQLQYRMMAWIFSMANHICSFTPDDVAAATAVPRDRVSRFLEDMAVHFGDVPEAFSVPEATHQLKTKPLLEHSGRYLCPAPVLFEWALQPMYEAHVKAAEGREWNRYEQHRHDYLVGKSVALLSQAMPEARFDHHLYYYPDPARPEVRAELDAVGVYDSVLFLAEAKGADLTNPAKRGAPDRLKRDLQEIVGASHAQAVRASEYIARVETARFFRGNGDLAYEIRRADITETFLISVSLAPLGHISAMLHATDDDDLPLFREGQYSWIVSIYDLMVIADVVDLPPVLTHYLRRRVRAARQGKLGAADELDVFGYYLKEGLYLEGPDVDHLTHFQLLTYTTDFDDYYFYKTGVRETFAPKPAQRMDPAFRKIVEAVIQSGLPGRVDVALQLLELSSRGRRDLVSLIEKARRIYKRERRLVDASVFGEGDGGWVITFMFDVDGDRLKERLLSYGRRKMSELAARRLTGIGELPGQVPRVLALVRLENEAQEQPKSA